MLLKAFNFSFLRFYATFKTTNLTNLDVQGSLL